MTNLPQNHRDPYSRFLGQSSARLYGVDGLTLEEAGEIVTDRYGLSTGSCVFSIPMDGQSTVSKVEANINIGQTTHPFASFLTLENRRIVLSPGFAKVVCSFAGCQSDSDYVYEFEASAKEEPMATHPQFPILQRRYGIAHQPDTGITFDAGGAYVTWGSLAVAEHVRFKSSSPLAGVEAYLDFSNGVYKATKATPTRPTTALSAIGTISTPPGNPPQFEDRQSIYKIVAPEKYYPPSGTRPGYYVFDYANAKLQRTNGGTRNWLYMGFAYNQRGSGYVVTHSWLLSGIGGWNNLVYQDTELDDFDD